MTEPKRYASTRSALWAGVLAALFVVLLLPAGSASAEPTLEGRRADARAVLAQVRQLDEDVGFAAERWNGANLRLREIESELRSTRAGLRRARARLRGCAGACR